MSNYITPSRYVNSDVYLKSREVIEVKKIFYLSITFTSSTSFFYTSFTPFTSFFTSPPLYLFLLTLKRPQSYEVLCLFGALQGFLLFSYRSP